MTLKFLFFHQIKYQSKIGNQMMTLIYQSANSTYQSKLSKSPQDVSNEIPEKNQDCRDDLGQYIV
jgi:hypothetical protein